MIVSDGKICNADTVISRLKKSRRLDVKSIEGRGWLMDILQCINEIPVQFFTLNDVYSFEERMQLKHHQNKNVRPKIRQQLQFLRDKGYIEFLGSGKYRKNM